ncbi:MAG: hypothetical protein IPL55_12500 [Saprospiraceae bacterium]|nr:hypothetical protein [Saprospiraceae bacterium]
MKVVNAFVFILFQINLLAQQVSDVNYVPNIVNPVYQSGKGPVIFIDEGHNNFHTKTDVIYHSPKF